ncbi:hypothetical protein [Arthrobacter sp. HY1533]|uniref:hypothetical protein n=1 Tax=Arthrobacter sp. HY1533 TaxID=2970919 RepID=UPI0022B9E938|nr:hypothetical protein [Arthrobacter sp. HY1533]
MEQAQFSAMAGRVVAALPDVEPVVPGWWTVVGAFTPVVALAAAVVAAVVGYRNLRQQQAAVAAQVAAHEQTLAQKTAADARSEWWRRTEWALEAAASANPALYAYGTGMLGLLATSTLADDADKELLDAVWRNSSTGLRDADIERLLLAADAPPGLAAGAEGPVGSGQLLETLRREILAARLKVTLDDQLRRGTSQTVKHLAEMTLPPIPVLP